jgi:hypothetical protein
MALDDRFAKALLKKARRVFNGYPVATIAYYGPDDRRASKVAVGIIMAQGEDAAELRRWFSAHGDGRRDATIRRELLSDGGSSVTLSAYLPYNNCRPRQTEAPGGDNGLTRQGASPAATNA